MFLQSQSDVIRETLKSLGWVERGNEIIKKSKSFPAWLWESSMPWIGECVVGMSGYIYPAQRRQLRKLGFTVEKSEGYVSEGGRCNCWVY